MLGLWEDFIRAQGAFFRNRGGRSSSVSCGYMNNRFLNWITKVLNDYSWMHSDQSKTHLLPLTAYIYKTIYSYLGHYTFCSLQFCTFQDMTIPSRLSPRRRRQPGPSIIKLSVPRGRECTAFKGNYRSWFDLPWLMPASHTPTDNIFHPNTICFAMCHRCVLLLK